MGIAGALIGGVASLAGANKAASAQKDAANSQIAVQREIYRDTSDKFQPFLESGQNALAAYQSELGLGARPAGYSGIDISPAAMFALEQGRDTIEAGAAGRGGLYSGATLQALERQRFGLAAQDRDTQLNRLASLANSGQSAAGNQAAAGQAFANGTSNALSNYGNAAAAGAVGSANAINGTINNALGAWQYQQHLNR